MIDFRGGLVFFDERAVTDKVDPAVRKALSKIGAYTRQRARTSVKKRKGTSPPGGPPYSHGADPFRNKIMFGYDPSTRSVVIGAILFGSKTGAPRIIEEGGVYKGVWHEARPTMAPAFNAELGKVGNDFRNLIV